MSEHRLEALMRWSAVLYALFLAPTGLWLLYGGSSDADLSRHIGETWQAGFWHIPGLSSAVSRYLLDGLEWLAVGGVTWLFWQAYCVLKHKTPDANAEKRRVLQWTALCGLLLAAVIPFHSSDLYGYLNRGFQQSVFGVNPYLTPVADMPGWAQQPLLHAHWIYNPCPYGFFFAQWAAWLTSLAQGHFVPAFLLMKCLNLFFLLGTVGLLARFARQTERPWLSAFLLGANPLVLLHVMGNGHNDILMVFLLLLSFAFLENPRWRWLSPPILVLSILTKYASLLAAPFMLVFLLRHRDWRALGLGGALAVSLAVFLALPYVELGQPWPWAALLDNAGKSQHSVADMLARLVYYPIKWLHLGDAKAVMAQVLAVFRPLFWGCFALFFVWRWRCYAKSGEKSLSALLYETALVMTVMVALVSAKFHPWYVVMFLPLALALPQNHWLYRFGVWFSVLQIAGFTLLQNVHVLNVVLLTLLPLWLAFRGVDLPCEKANEAN
jgi:alpha-1,6-mannosyltransferase